MTANQINYQKSLEDKRSHLANEDLTRARDAETQRANRSRESEAERSNKAREAEDLRSHQASEAYNYYRTGVESGDRRYQTDQGLIGTIYSADRSYDSRTDSAYINKYGISPEDAKYVGTALGNTFGELVNSEPVKKAVSVGARILYPTLKKAATGGAGQVTGTSSGTSNPKKSNNSRRH